MRAPERQEVIDHAGEARDLFLDRPELRGARAGWLPAPQHGRVGADHGQWVAQIVADLRDVQPALAVEIAQAGCERLERPGHTADFAATGDECDIAVAVADLLGGEHDRLEVLAMAPAGALEQPHADEHQHETDRCEPLGFDQQQIAFDVLWRAARGEHSAPAQSRSAMVPRSRTRGPSGQPPPGPHRHRLRHPRARPDACPGCAGHGPAARRARRRRACASGSSCLRAPRARAPARRRTTRLPPARARRRSATAIERRASSGSSAAAA